MKKDELDEIYMNSKHEDWDYFIDGLHVSKKYKLVMIDNEALENNGYRVVTEYPEWKSILLLGMITNQAF